MASHTWLSLLLGEIFLIITLFPSLSPPSLPTLFLIIVVVQSPFYFLETIIYCHKYVILVNTADLQS